MSDLGDSLVVVWPADEASATDPMFPALGDTTLSENNDCGSVTPGWGYTYSRTLSSAEGQFFSADDNAELSADSTYFSTIRINFTTVETPGQGIASKWNFIGPKRDVLYLIDEGGGVRRLWLFVRNAAGDAETQLISDDTFAADTWNALAWGYDDLDQVIWLSVNGAPKQTVSHTDGVSDDPNPYLLGADQGAISGDFTLNAVTFSKGYTPSDEELAWMADDGGGVPRDPLTWGAFGTTLIEVTLAAAGESLLAAELAPSLAGEGLLTVESSPSCNGESLLTVSVSPVAAGEHLGGVTASAGAAGESLLTVSMTPTTAGESLLTVSVSPTMAGEQLAGLSTSIAAAGESLLTVAVTPGAAGESLLTVVCIPAAGGEHLAGVSTTAELPAEHLLSNVVELLASMPAEHLLSIELAPSAPAEHVLTVVNATGLAGEQLAGVVVTPGLAGELLLGIVVTISPAAESLLGCSRSVTLAAEALCQVVVTPSLPAESLRIGRPVTRVLVCWTLPGSTLDWTLPGERLEWVLPGGPMESTL